ncbi:undecaprenyl-diphosphatase [Micromonospora pattaloongensis]|uniref:Undecaprenyl-diphosphatase n=1 Tax=Micromonospora pattaloongensis TaxID=405436 RepID=A0A1H3PU45_9ACTN|nr:undecaprenyl-diphosphatase [Micromonospora pattaloongensis]
MALLLLALGAAVVAGLAPGGWGRPEPVDVTAGASASAYRWVVDGSTRWHGPAELVGEAALVLLVLLAAAVWWVGRRRGPQATARTALVAVGATVAYALSEALKPVVDEQRPCRALTGLPPVDCPPVGDWSFPSNHATIAGALAVGLALLAPRLAALTLPLGLVAAGLRVAAGAHYPHDVIAGLVLGATVTAATVLAFGPLAARLTAALGTVPGVRRLVVAGQRS